jgi:hypothetical protein
MSPTPFTEIVLGGSSPDWLEVEVLADTAVFFGVCEFSPEGAATKNREPRIGRLRVRADARRSRRFTDSSESD